jgi:adenylate cyclase
MSNSTKPLTRLYVASLGTIALLAITGQIIIQRQLNRQASDVAILTTAQTRQQLCERLLKLTLATQLTNPENQPQTKTELAEVLKNWEDTRTVLKQQMQSQLTPQEMAETDAMFAKLKPLSDEILTLAKQKIAPENITKPLDTLHLIKTGTEFNQTIDSIIRWYSDKAAKGVSRLKAIEFALLSLTLITLTLEGLFIFKPAIGKLKDAMEALERSLRQLTLEQEKSEKLLLNILPATIADRLKRHPTSIADSFTSATVLFADIVGFTELSSRLAPQDLVQCLNEVFSRFDTVAERYGLEKIKTIGDAYMVVGGLPKASDNHAEAIVNMALAMQGELDEINRKLNHNLNIRIGINTGPVVAGVIGIRKFIYDLWGDAVNVASRMESHGEPGAIHISAATYELIKDKYICESRGQIYIKGKGEMHTYWVKGVSAQHMVRSVVPV